MYWYKDNFQFAEDNYPLRAGSDFLVQSIATF